MKKLFGIAVAFVIAGGAGATEPIFVSPDQTRAQQILPAPPDPDSPTAKDELAELHRIEAARSEADAAKAKFDEENENIFLFAAVFGDKFTKENLPTLDALGKRVENDESLNTAVAKESFHRVRPYNADPTLHPVCRTKKKDDSYPSGHTTTGYLLALTLIDIVPEKRDALLARADEYGRNRLVCGVHYPSDLVGGRLAAYAIHAVMAQHPNYQSEVAAARAELRRTLGLASAY